MPWAKLDDEFWLSEKIAAISNDAGMLYTVGLSYCAKMLTDGFLSDKAVAKLCIDRQITDPQKTIGELTTIHAPADEPLWHAEPGGYRIHNYLSGKNGVRRNPSRAEVEAQRAEDARRQAEWRKSHRDAKEDSPFVSHSVTTAVTNGVTNRRPVPVPDPVPGPDPIPGPEEDTVVADAPTPPAEPVPVLFGEDTPEYRLAWRLRDKILQRNPRARVPGATPAKLSKWARAFHVLLKRYSLDEILAVLDWCQADSFWCGNILSAPTFAEKFDKLFVQMTERGKPPNGKARASPERTVDSWGRRIPTVAELQAAREDRQEGDEP